MSQQNTARLVVRLAGVDTLIEVYAHPVSICVSRTHELAARNDRC